MLKKSIATVLVLLLYLMMLSACQQEQTELKEDIWYTVTFQDHTGKVLDSQQVKAGQSATAPEFTPEEGYVFVGWDRDFSSITKDTVVKALYSLTATQSLMIPEMTALPGQSITVPVVIVENPGIAGAKITLVYDPSLTLKSSENGRAFSCLDYTVPGKYMSPCSFTWDSESGMATEDGEILRLTFQVPEDAPSGKTYALNCVYTEGDIYDEDLNNVSLGVINGMITVE